MLKLEYDKKEIEEVIDKIVKKTMNMDLTWDWPCGVAYYGISDAYEKTGKKEYLELLKGGEAMRQALLEGKWIYCPQISKSMPDLHFLHAEKTCNRVMAYTKSPVNKTVYQEKNGKIIPYVPALKKVSKTKRNNSLKM